MLSYLTYTRQILHKNKVRVITNDSYEMSLTQFMILIKV